MHVCACVCLSGLVNNNKTFYADTCLRAGRLEEGSIFYREMIRDTYGKSPKDRVITFIYGTSYHSVKFCVYDFTVAARLTKTLWELLCKVIEPLMTRRDYRRHFRHCCRMIVDRFSSNIFATGGT